VKLQLVSPVPDVGFAFNQGAYWPVGLLTIASHVKRCVPDLDIELFDEALVDQHRRTQNTISGDIVGIQAASCLTYGSVLRLAEAAKRKGAYVIVGGAFATELGRQILEKRGCIDAVVVGSGEAPMVAIVETLRQGSGIAGLRGIPGVWSRCNGGIVGTDSDGPFDYERCRPLDYSLVPVSTYHRNYHLMNPYFDGACQIFTHFGCKYRETRRSAGKEWCTYCSLSDRLVLRTPEDICTEVREALKSANVRPGARLMLKCYGDNASALCEHLDAIARALAGDPVLVSFDLWWSLYAQSSFITPRLVEVLQRLRVWEVYIGFDSGDDGIQRLNSLGTTTASHLRAARLLRDAGIRIQAGFVLGCAGETKDSMSATVRLAETLAGLGNVDLFHASPLVVLPGSPAFRMLCGCVPALRDIDFLNTTQLQHEWIRHFCPQLGEPESALHLLDRTARGLVALGRMTSSFGGWAERDGAPSRVEAR
jgi:radical SAM superfamily enzyme YgiQ (UPF0313 family)